MKMMNEFNKGDIITINGKEFTYVNSYLDKPDRYRFECKEDQSRIDLWQNENGEWVTEPYYWLKVNDIETGTILYSPAYGEVKFVECSHNFIICQVDDNVEVPFSMHGRICWFNEKYNCYRFDDESDLMLYPIFNRNIWSLIVDRK